MNHWTELSIAYANQRSYLDDLFQVYPTIPEGIREIDTTIWKTIERNFRKRDNIALMQSLLKLEIFPIKDSYIAFLKRDQSALARNPKTVNRICGRLYEMGLPKIFERCSEPKETNRQIGPLFKRWIDKKSLGIQPVNINTFTDSNVDAILDGSDAQLRDFARQELNYYRAKGLDLVARFHGQYVIAEAKFLTDFGGHQNAQFEDAVTLFKLSGLKAIPIAVLDGVAYLKGDNKLFRQITEDYATYNIMSALVLREFLYQL